MEILKAFAEDLEKSGEYSGKILFEEPMSRHTTFKIGGPVPVFFEPADVDSLLVLLNKIKTAGVRFFILGGGSNLVFCDQGFDGVVISMASLNQIVGFEQPDGNVFVSCGAGATMAQLVNYCTEHQLSGAEQFAGLPGTLGGALFMNARCFDRSVSDLFVDAYYIDLNDFTEQHLTYSKSDWDYKQSPFQNTNKLILQANLRLEKSDKTKEEINSICKKYTEERISKGHFKFPSAGSVFRNNHEFGAPSGKLIDECGLKGTQIGQAQIAPFHGNFIINLGGATQKDVNSLVELTVNRVREKFGFTLQSEIIFVK